MGLAKWYLPLFIVQVAVVSLYQLIKYLDDNTTGWWRLLFYGAWGILTVVMEIYIEIRKVLDAAKDKSRQDKSQQENLQGHAGVQERKAT